MQTAMNYLLTDNYNITSTDITLLRTHQDAPVYVQTPRAVPLPSCYCRFAMKNAYHTLPEILSLGSHENL